MKIRKISIFQKFPKVRREIPDNSHNRFDPRRKHRVLPPKHLKTTDASRRAKVIIHLLHPRIIHLSRIFHTVVHGSWSRAAWQTSQICSPNRSSNIGRAIYPCQVDQCPVQTAIHQPLHCGHFGLSRLSKRLRFRISPAREADFHSPLLFKRKPTKVSRFSFRRVRFVESDLSLITRRVI